MAISSLSLEELGHLIKKKQEDKKEEVEDKERNEDTSKNSEEEQK